VVTQKTWNDMSPELQASMRLASEKLAW